MRIFTLFLRTLLPLLAFLTSDAALSQAAAPGILDSTFGASGARVLTIGTYGGEFRDVAKQADGKLVAVGWLRTGSGDAHHSTAML